MTELKNRKSVHTSRTIMFSELTKVMDHAVDDDSYIDSLNLNVINKSTKSGVNKTSRYLKQLYDLDINKPSFKAFKYFWKITDFQNKSLLSLLYAINSDYLLAESIPIINGTRIQEKVTIEKIEDIIETNYPQSFSKNTLRSLAQNIASTWKQAGFITGKVKNIRTQPEIHYTVVAFASLLAYLNDIKGDFIFKSKWIKALSSEENKIRELAIEASKHDLMQYQNAGNVTSIAFTNLLNKLEINGI